MTTIKQLRHFLVLAEELHFAKAAAILGITQSTLSNEIKKMEESLGFKLFDRSDKWDIALTIPGKNFLRHVKDIPSMLESARQNALEIARGQAGILTIAVSNFAYDLFNIGELCRKMRLAYPGVKLKIYDVQRSPQVVKNIRNGQVDVGFFMVSSPEKQAANLKYRQLSSLQMMLGIHCRHPLAVKKHITYDDLKNVPFILPPREETPVIRSFLDEIFMKHCQTLPNVSLEVIGFTGIKQLIATGHGVGLLPQNISIHPEIILRELPFKIPRMLIAACDISNTSLIVKNFMALLNDPD